MTPTEATEKLHTAEQTLLECSAELDKTNEALDPVRAELARIDTLSAISQKDLLTAENLRREARQLEAKATAADEAVAKAKANVGGAQLELKRAEHAALLEKIHTTERALMEHAQTLDADLEHRIAALRQLHLEADMRPTSIGLALGNAPSGGALERTGAALRLWRAFESQAQQRKAQRG